MSNQFFSPLSFKVTRRIIIISIGIPLLGSVALFNIFFLAAWLNWKFWVFNVVPVFLFLWLILYLLTSARNHVIRLGVLVVLVLAWLLIQVVAFDKGTAVLSLRGSYSWAPLTLFTSPRYHLLTYEVLGNQYLVDLDNTHKETLLIDNQNKAQNPFGAFVNLFAPSSPRIAYVDRGGNLYIYDHASGSREVVNQNTEKVVGEFWVSWIDDSHIAYSCNKNGPGYVELKNQYEWLEGESRCEVNLESKLVTKRSFGKDEYYSKGNLTMSYESLQVVSNWWLKVHYNNIDSGSDYGTLISEKYVVNPDGSRKLVYRGFSEPHLYWAGNNLYGVFGLNKIRKLY